MSPIGLAFPARHWLKTRWARQILPDSVNKLHSMVDSDRCYLQHHDVGLVIRHTCWQRIKIHLSNQCRFTCLVALSSIFTEWLILQWGVVAKWWGWCCETDPSPLQHGMDRCRPQSRFSTTDHRECHFREESLEKMTVLTSKKRSRIRSKESQ